MSAGNSPEEEQRAHQALRLYRYLSWFLTSMAYLAECPRRTLAMGFGVILALFWAGHFAAALYRNRALNRQTVYWLVTAEMLGIALLLMPTGGLNSPFIWYALNPIMMAALLLPGPTCWLVLSSFLMAASVGSLALYKIPFADLWRGKQWMLLVLMLLTASAQLYSRLIAGLKRSYADLFAAHRESERLLGYTSSLYLALESFVGEENPNHLASMLAGYMCKLTGAAGAACLFSSPERRLAIQLTDSEAFQDDRASRIAELHSIWDVLQDGQVGCIKWPVGVDGTFTWVCSPIRTDSGLYGVLAVMVDAEGGKGVEKTLAFLADLGALAFERHQTDEMAAQLLVAEEQNRIANEIHDGVSQRLFSMVYALHSIAQQQGNVQDTAVQEQLQLVKRTASEAAKDLRASIYRLSPGNQGEQVFVAGLGAYLADLGNLNNIRVDFVNEGSESVLSPALRQALYRVVREATANATRHGKCSHIEVQLAMLPSSIKLQVVDNGTGFDAERLKWVGLGLTNMQGLMASFGGSFRLESRIGIGTTVTCAIPAEKQTSDWRDHNADRRG